MRGFPYRSHRCKYCGKIAVTFPHGHPLCAEHAALPDSEEWVAQFEIIKTKYLEYYGLTSWNAFCLRTFDSDGKNYEDFTWKEMAQLTEEEFNHPAECKCVLPEQSCPICRSLAQVVYEEEK
jgi:hypothetical protein